MWLKIPNKTFALLKQGGPKLSTAAPRVKLQDKCRMNAWQIHCYGDINDLKCESVRMPQVRQPDQILVKVEASSLNPIDLYMLGGYGRTLFRILRKFEKELPLTLGRDFSGTVISKGPKVGNLNVGDKVYGFIPIQKPGSFSEVIAANKAHVRKQPKTLSPSESTSLVFTSMTAWSALYLFGGLAFTGAKGYRVLILGASGGIGTVAVPMLKSQECIVHGTCSSDALPLVTALGAEYVFDYKHPDYLKNIETSGYYHLILDCAKFGYENVPRGWKFGTYITLDSPLFVNTDQFGLARGLLYSYGTFLRSNMKPPWKKKRLMWGFFVPSSRGFDFVDKLIKSGKIQPLIHKEYKFDKLPEAFAELQKGHMRGKIVVTH